uniref:Cleft lip and palate transmembrane protein 1 n=1 Tax=Strigamia maritima TaxID=126957 RepID=T1J5T4_STRMM
MACAGEGDGHAQVKSSCDSDKQIVQTQDSSNATPNGEISHVTEQTASTNENPQAENNARVSFFGVAKSLMVRALIIYFITSFFRSPQTQNTGNEARKPSSNLFANGTAMDMYVYLSEDEFFQDFNNSKALIWLQKDLLYGDWESGENKDGSYRNEMQVPASQSLMNNGSLYVHVYFVKAGRSPDPVAKGKYTRKFTVSKYKMLTRYKKTTQKLQRLLMSDAPVEETKPVKGGEIVSHWHPNLTINIINDQTQWVQGNVQFEPASGKYFPIVYLNDYWNLNRDYQPINETTPILNFTVTYQPISLFKWQMYTAQSMRSRWTANIFGENAIEESDEEQDSLKEAIVETNPYLLGITVVVSIFHTVFELLAFKNDIQFWKNRRSLEGLSVRSVFFNVFQSLIVLLYVLDNETNTLVRISVFIGLAIDIWKIQKVVNIERVGGEKFLGFIPKIKISDKGSYAESSTKEYDMMAFRYLSWALYPLLFGYAIYSVLYQEHKGWYSWLLSMLYGFLLTFGFIMMTPQLFINYKLKSVAHMPWRMMTYKALNTFIDDIFAFVIKMPTMYRIGCFRDDIVFFIFLYQRWVYRVDPSRVNEFGTSAEMEQGVVATETPQIEKKPTENNIY